MSARKILGFLLAVILLLGAVAVFFPPEGLDVGPVHLRFPSLEQVLEVPDTAKVSEAAVPVLSPEQQLARMEEAFRLDRLSQLADSLDWFREFFGQSPVSICFPGDDPTFFDPVFEALSEARETPVHIMHYGDSQIEQDRITAVLRTAFQERYGGFGPGLIPAIQALSMPNSVQEYSGDLTKYTIYGPATMRADHRRYGPMGLVCEVRDSAHISLQPRYRNRQNSSGQFTHIRVLYGHNSEGFRAELALEGGPSVREQSDSTEFGLMEWQLDRPVRELELAFYGDADIYGLSLESENGVQVDNISMRGCSGTVFTSIDEKALRETLHRFNVRLIILQFGGNRMPSIQEQKDIDLYARQIGRQLRFFHRLAPEARLLFVGPSDMSVSVDGELVTYPMLEPTVEALRAVCLENNTAFWDMYRVMGGRNSMVEWVKAQPPMAAADHVHFTVKGARHMAQLLRQSLEACDDYHRFRQQHLNDSIMQEIQQLDRTHDYARELEEILESCAAASPDGSPADSTGFCPADSIGPDDLQDEEGEGLL